LYKRSNATCARNEQAVAWPADHLEVARFVCRRRQSQIFRALSWTPPVSVPPVPQFVVIVASQLASTVGAPPWQRTPVPRRMTGGFVPGMQRS